MKVCLLENQSYKITSRESLAVLERLLSYLKITNL